MPEPAEVARRPPSQVMRLDRLGSMHQSRLSFMRVLLRRVHRERWRVRRAIFDIDSKGVGVATYEAAGPDHTYTLICFAHDLPDELRSDRVIAEAWDATFTLFDGIPSAADLERLGRDVPRQEAGRYRASELILARANRSARLFDEVVTCLARGLQPSQRSIETVGYLMRTTAVYGNGKFGIADRDRISGRPEMAGPFQAEMLTVWLIRAFTVDWAEQLAAMRGGASAVQLHPWLRRRLGIGNATGLGMAPFLVRHPVLINNWISARETALERVRALPSASTGQVATFGSALARFRRELPRWSTDDPVLAPRIGVLAADLARLADAAAGEVFSAPSPWNGLYRWAEDHLSLEGQEAAVSLLLEPHPALVDPLFGTMATDESADFTIDGRASCRNLSAIIERTFAWALSLDFTQASERRLFWYVSEEKLEPRLGDRFSEPGAGQEQPLTVARDVASLQRALATFDPAALVAEFLARNPEHRHAVRRVQIADKHPFAEIRGNLIHAEFRAIDLLRCKLSFFGATRFDPRSDKWLRITMYQNAPFPDEIADDYREDWAWGPEDETC